MVLNKIRSLFERKNEDEAKRVIFELFYNKVYQTAYFITRDPYLAQDVLQESFIKAFHYLDQLESGDKLEKWLTTITTRTAIDLLRKRKVWNGIPVDDQYLHSLLEHPNHSVEAEVEKGILKEWVKKGISELKPEYRAVIILKYILDLKDQEIADILNENIGTVKTRIFRAKKKLRDQLQQDVMDGDIS